MHSLRCARRRVVASLTLVGWAIVAPASVTATVTTGDRPVFVPISPCRLFDTRAGENVGPRTAPLAQGDTHMQPVVGTNGNCTIPAGISAVAMNVTAVNGTSGSFLTIFPTDSPRPLASSLNWVPGSPPTPNKVDVKVSADGRVSFFNNAGSVDVLADVVGYYIAHDHDARYPLRSVMVAKFTATTGSVNIAASDLVPRFADTARRDYDSGNTCMYISNWVTSLELEASVPLPVGARLTQFNATLFDNWAPTDIEFDLVRRNATGVSIVTTGFSNTSAPVRQLIGKVFPAETVDHDEYFYVYVRPEPAAGSNHQMCGFQAFYDIPTPPAPPSTADDNVFQPINPCRLFDTRASAPVGPRSVPLTAGEEVVQAVTGTNGNCTVPNDATAVALNVTTVNGTAPSFLSIWPADVARPLASSLNWGVGSPPTPNKVDVKLSAAGSLKFFNNAGTIDLLADVVGYYAPHEHDDRYMTASEIDARQLRTAGSVVIGYPAFAPEGSVRSSTDFGCGYLRSTSTSTWMSASVPAPVGSTIRKVRILVRDTSASASAQIEVRKDTFPATRTTVATATSAGLASGDRVIEATLATPDTVGPNETFTVSVDVGVSPNFAAVAGDTGVGVCGTEVFYDAPTPLLAPSTAATAVFVPITPCRLFDTRPANQVGPRNTPLGAGDTLVQDVAGTNGNCVVPPTATAVAMNVTTVGGSAPSFLTIWPSDVGRPLASSLNWVPGSPPTPNKVDVKLSANGRVSVFNNAGTVDVLADVVGYYANHDHDERYPAQPDENAFFPATRSFTISAAAFRLARSVNVVDWSSGCQRPTNQAVLSASLPIPDGAALQSVRVFVQDTTATGRALMEVHSANAIESLFLFGASTSDANVAGFQVLTLLPSTPTPSFSKTLSLRYSPSSDTGLAICGAEVTYAE